MRSNLCVAVLAVACILGTDASSGRPSARRLLRIDARGGSNGQRSSAGSSGKAIRN